MSWEREMGGQRWRGPAVRDSRKAEQHMRAEKSARVIDKIPAGMTVP